LSHGCEPAVVKRLETSAQVAYRSIRAAWTHLASLRLVSKLATELAGSRARHKGAAWFNGLERAILSQRRIGILPRLCGSFRRFDYVMVADRQWSPVFHETLVLFLTA